MSWTTISVQRNLPYANEILATLRNHPLIPSIGKVKNVYVVGSFSIGEERDDSDIDILLEIYPVSGYTSAQFAERNRQKIMQYFVTNKIEGKADHVHPQWNGRRIDVYFTYDASLDSRPKIKI